MCRFRHAPKRGGDLSDGNRGHRHHLKLAARQFCQHDLDLRAQQVRLLRRQFCEIDCMERGIVAQGMEPQRGIGVDVAFADLEKTAACGENRNALLEEGAGQGIEHDIDPAAVGLPSHVIREGERARIEYLLDAASMEIASLLLTSGCRENFGAQRLRDADCRQPDSSRRGMDQHALAALEAGKRHECIVRRRKGDRDRGGGGE
jgi:hypothetical protein